MIYRNMKINIDILNEKELIDLNRKIVERLKFLESMRAHSEMLEFSVGEKVLPLHYTESLPTIKP